LAGRFITSSGPDPFPNVIVATALPFWFYFSGTQQESVDSADLQMNECRD
jgi:hypothetical protein